MKNTKYKLISISKIDSSELETVHIKYLNSIGTIYAQVGKKMIFEPDNDFIGLGILSSIIQEIKVIDEISIIITENSIYKFEKVKEI